MHRCDTPLTEEQREFAAAHYQDTYLKIVRFHNWQDQYADAALDGYLVAVRDYCERIHLQKYSFCTIAKTRMRGYVSKKYRKDARRQGKVRFISYETHPQNDLCLLNVLPSPQIGPDEWAEEMEEAGILHEALETLSQPEKLALQYLSVYGRPRDVSKILNYPYRKTLRIIKNARNAMKEALKEKAHEPIETAQ